MSWQLLKLWATKVLSANFWSHWKLQLRFQTRLAEPLIWQLPLTTRASSPLEKWKIEKCRYLWTFLIWATVGRGCCSSNLAGLSTCHWHHHHHHHDHHHEVRALNCHRHHDHDHDHEVGALVGLSAHLKIHPHHSPQLSHHLLAAAKRFSLSSAVAPISNPLPWVFTQTHS